MRLVSRVRWGCLASREQWWAAQELLDCQGEPGYPPSEGEQVREGPSLFLWEVRLAWMQPGHALREMRLEWEAPGFPLAKGWPVQVGQGSLQGHRAGWEGRSVMEARQQEETPAHLGRGEQRRGFVCQALPAMMEAIVEE